MNEDFKLMKETLESAYEYIPRAIAGSNVISTNIQGGREDKAMALCIDLIDGLKWLIDAIILTKPIQIEYDRLVNIDEVNDLFSQIVEAFENSDYVLLSDLLEYELTPTLNKWQDEIDDVLSKVGDENV